MTIVLERNMPSRWLPTYKLSRKTLLAQAVHNRASRLPPVPRIRFSRIAPSTSSPMSSAILLILLAVAVSNFSHSTFFKMRNYLLCSLLSSIVMRLREPYIYRWQRLQYCFFQEHGDQRTSTTCCQIDFSSHNPVQHLPNGLAYLRTGHANASL